MKTLPPGSHFKLTGQFLRNTGQHLGPEGQSTWTVVACDCPFCAQGRFVASDEKSVYGDGQRHFAVANIYRYGTLDHRNVP